MSTGTLPDAPPAAAPGDGEALYEVVNGQRVEVPPMGIISSWIGGLLFLRLGTFVLERRLGRAVAEALFILDPQADLRRRPDVAFVSAERWPLDRPFPSGDWPIVPDLAVEVTSPRDLHDTVLGKVSEYFQHGVRQVWVVEPAQRLVYVYDSPMKVRVLSEADVLATDVVPGFSLNINELSFEQPGVLSP